MKNEHVLGLPNGQVFEKRKMNNLESFWQAVRSKFAYDYSSEDLGPICYFSRLALWLYCLGFLMAPALSLLQAAPLGQKMFKLHIAMILPGTMLALLVAYGNSKINILFANFTLHILNLLIFFFTIPLIITYGSNSNYYIFLPLLALANLSLLFMWSEYPKSILTVVIIHICSIIGSAVIFDPHWKNQIGAFYIYLFINLCIFLFNLISRQMATNLQKSMYQARASAIDAETKDKMLNLAVEVNFPALICFDNVGALIAKRGEMAHRFMPVPNAYGDVLTLDVFLRHFQTKFGVDLSLRNDSSQEISIHGRHFLISRRDSTDIVAFAFIDITERVKQATQIQESQKLSMIGEITSGIAHDYNNLLAIMLANLEAIPEDKRNDIWSPYLTTTYKSIDQAKSISAKLLTIAGKREFKLKTVPISQVIQDLAPLLRTAVGDKILLTIKVQDGLYAITDASELESTVLNLVVNARNAIISRNGEIDVTVYEHGDNTVIEVIDNGKGISKKDISKVFDPFYTTKNRQNSTGLGLSLVKSFVKQCGGKIDLQSRPGQTCFRLCFPKVPAPATETAISKTLAVDRTGIKHQRLLLIDDNVEFIQTMQMLLSGKGYRCIATSSATEAIEAAQKNPDITSVILDLSMPDQNGIELSQHLIPLLPQATFILQTGDIDNETETLALESGFSAVLMKPVKVHDLIQTLDKFAHNASEKVSG